MGLRVVRQGQGLILSLTNCEGLEESLFLQDLSILSAMVFMKSGG